MLSDLALGLRWNASLGAKFLRVVPFSTLIIVLLTLVSQVAMLLASVLPLKVIIMLGAEGIPRYFPDFLASLGRDVLIGVLAAGTVGFFLMHLVAEKMIRGVTGYATNRLLAKSQKMVLFENQEELAASSYQRYSRALAGGVFIALALVGMGWFYPEMSLVILGYFLFMLQLLWLGALYGEGIRERLENRLGQFMNVWASVGFFVAFAYLVIDFVFFTPPGMIVALVSFLLIRQAMHRVAGMIADLTSLYRQKPKLNALFFHGQVLLLAPPDLKKGLWPMLMPEARQVWVAGVLNTLVDGETDELECQWHQLGNPSLVGLRVRRGKQQFLLKLYDSKRSSLALHEAGLMAEQPRFLPAAQWLGTVPVEKLQCLVYRLESGSQPQIRQVKRFAQQLRGDLLAARPSLAAIQRYVRSKAMLWQRLGTEQLERLRIAVITADQQHDLAVLLARLPMLHQLLEALPLAVLNPEMGQDAIWVSDAEGEQKGKAILLNWGRWSLEPVGAGWPEAEKLLNSLGDALQAGALRRMELEAVKVEQAELAALAFALERECSRQHYNQALDLIPRILERLVSLESSDLSRNINAE